MTAFNRNLFPSFLSLIAFECAARHANFTRAAEELHLTQGAVSHQIRQLEEILGFQLFERVRQRVILTPAGKTYLSEMVAGLRRISESTNRALASGGLRIFNLAVLPTFATKWLMRRMPDFLEKHPQISVNFVSRNAPFAFANDTLDAAIHYGERAWPGTLAEELFPEEMVPLASPALREKLGLETPGDLTRARLLQQFTRPSVWADWFASVGVSMEDAYRGPRFDNFSMAAEAARAGMGVALLPHRIFQEELQSGALCMLFPHILPSNRSYYLVYPEANRSLEVVTAFSAWITDQARMS